MLLSRKAFENMDSRYTDFGQAIEQKLLEVSGVLPLSTVTILGMTYFEGLVESFADTGVGEV